MAELNNQSLAAVYEQMLADQQASATNFATQRAAQYQSALASRQQQQLAEAERQRQQQDAAAAAAAEAERTRDRTLGEFAADTGLATAQTFTGLAGAAYGGANVLTGGLLDRDLGFSQNLQDAQQLLEAQKSAPFQARKERAAQAFERGGLAAGAGEYLTNPSLLFDLGVQSAAYLIPGTFAARVAGGAAAARAAASNLPKAAQALAAHQAATRAGLVAQGALTGGYLNPEAINAAREAGVSEGGQQLAGLGAAAVGAITGPLISKATGAAGLEARAANALFGGASLPAQAGSAAARMGAFTTTQAVEEATQEATEQAILNVAGQRPIAEGTGQAAVLGGILGGALGGAMGLTQIRQPSATRQELADLQAAVETELAGETGAPVVRPSLIRQAALQDAQNKLAASEQARVHPLAQREEIDLATAPMPGAVSEEISLDQYAPAPEPVAAALPQVEQLGGRSVQDIIRETAPIERVAEQFGPAVAGAEQARRMAAQAPTSVEAPAAPLDLSTPKAVGEYRRSVKQELARATGRDVGAIRGPQFDALAEKLVSAGVRPGTPEFNTLVGVETARQLQAVERGGKTNNLLGALNNAYPVTQEQQLDAAFDRGGVPTTEEELFGAMPEQQAPARPTFVDTPAAQVETVERGQQWVSKDGEVYTVAAMFNGRPQLRSESGKVVNRSKAGLVSGEWSLRQPLEQAVQAAAPKPQRDLTVKEQIADLGGILTSYRQDITGDTKASTAEAAPGRGRIFSETGTSPDDMAMQLAERNFVPAEELARDGGVQWLYNAVNRSLAGEKVYAVGSEAQMRQFDAQMAEQQRESQQPADASKPSEVTAEAPRYNQQQWVEYLAYPGAAQLNALTSLKEREGNPQPVLAAMLMGIDIAGDMTEYAQLANAAQAHPEFFLMSQTDRGQVSTHMATALNRLLGATFELGVPKKTRATELQRALAMSEDDYIAAINPTGKTSAEDDIVLVRVGDLERPAGSQQIASFTDTQGGQVTVFADDIGTLYAEQDGQVVGQIESRDGETLNIVAQEVQGRGIGKGLAKELIKREPFAPAGSLSPAGEATRRAAFRALKAEQAKFAQGAVDTGMNKRLFDKGVEAAARNLGRPIFGFDTVAQLEEQLGFPMPESVKGVYIDGNIDGNIYVVRDNIADGKDLSLTIAHELGHSGLASLLGSSLKTATNRMWANADMRKRIRGKMAELNMAQGTEEERRASRTLAAEEVLADMLAGNERLNKDIWSKLRAGVREFFARAFGIRSYIVTNKEVDDLLTDVARVLKGAPAAQVREEMQNASLWINDADQAAEADPKFSKAKGDLDVLLDEAQREGASNVRPFSDAGKALSEASVGAAKSVWSALKEGRMGSMLVHNFMGLDQQVEWYDKLFRLPGQKTGLLSKIYNLKGDREAEFNRHIGAEKPHQYTTVRNGEEVTENVGTFSVHDMISDWDTYKRKNPAKAAALDFVNSEGTFYKVFPDRAWADQSQDVDYDDAGYTEAERKAAWERASKAYNALDAKGKSLYQKAQSVYGRMISERFTAITAEAERLGQRAESAAKAAGVDVDIVASRVAAAQARYKAQVATILGKISQGPYSPLMRFGDYVLTVRDTKGDVVHFAAFDSIAERDAAAAEMTNIPDGFVVSTSMTRDQVMDAAGVKRGEVEAIRNEVMALLPDDMEPDIRDSAVAAITAGLAEAYLQSLPAKSFAKHALARKNVAGYDTNSLRAFSNYTIRGARSIAGIKYDGQIGNAMTEMDQYVRDVGQGKYADGEGVKRVDATKLQDVANGVKRQHMASMRVDDNKLSNALTSTAFMFQLTSPSQLLFNATQTPMVAFPRLAGIYGAGKASKALGRALKDFTASGFDLMRTDSGTAGAKSVLRAGGSPVDAKVLEAMQQIKDDGPLDITQAHDVSGIADGTAGELHPYWGTAMRWLSYSMHKSEVFNRQITALAAVRMELDKQIAAGVRLDDPAMKDALVRVGKHAIDSTQFNFAKYAKPALMQGPVGKVVLQYRLYQLNMLSTMARDIRDGLFGADAETKKIARETLAWTIGMQVAFLGTAGTILAPIAFAIADLFRDDDDLITSRQAYTAAVGKFAAHGAFAGLLDMGRVEAGSLIPILGQSAYAPVDGKPGDTFSYYVTQNLGPSFGLAKNLYTGMANVANGEFEKGVQNLLPKPFADLHKLYFDGTEGVRNAQGVVYDTLSPWSAATQFLGLRSGERRQVEERRSAFYTANAKQYAVRDKYLAKLALGHGTGDRDLIAEANASIQEWNQRYPDLSIKAQDISRAIVKRARTQALATQTGLVTSRPLGPTFDELLRQ